MLNIDRECVIQGIAIKVSVSPCSWMHEHYGLQLSIREVRTLGRAHPLYLHIKKDYSVCDENDVIEMLATLTRTQCPTCANSMFDSPLTSHKGEHSRVCDTCMNKMLDDYTQEVEAEDALEKANAKAMGMKYVLNAYIHPVSGDDICVRKYFKKKPSDEEIKKFLSRNYCTRLNDYHVSAL